MNDNYPDDIRNYDHDPRSPFYKEPGCKCGKMAQSDCMEDEECGEPLYDDRDFGPEE